MKKNKYLAIIPARKGSKRLPNKNILELEGKPLIAWTIEAALNSKYLDLVMVSTDSEDIAEIAKNYGAEVPFIRPEHLSTDAASSFDVAKHVLDFYDDKGINYEYIVLLQPTSPLRTSIDIDKAIELQIQKKADSITSVCEVDHSPLWSNTLTSSLSMENFIRPEIKGMRSQDLEKFYRLNGAIYINNVIRLLKDETFIAYEKAYAYIMDKMNSVDIDDEFDFLFAQFLIKKTIEK